jgi:hypothetical protein
VFQHTEDARYGMFELKPAAERKVSFERDKLDASKACHISAMGNVGSRAAGAEAPARSGKTAEVLSASAALNACGSDKRGARVICSSDSEVCRQAQNPVAHFFRHFRHFRQLSSRAGLRQLVGLSDRSLPGRWTVHLCSGLRSPHSSGVRSSGSSSRTAVPEQASGPFLGARSRQFSILPYKVCALDPEGEFPRGMPFDAHHGVVVHINPDFTFKQILVFPLGYSFGDETAVRT